MFSSQVLGTSWRYLADVSLKPPQYATAPRILWVLSPLLPEGCDLRLDEKSAASIANAREVLRNDSTLDASQAEAVVEHKVNQHLLRLRF